MTIRSFLFPALPCRRGAAALGLTLALLGPLQAAPAAHAAPYWVLGIDDTLRATEDTSSLREHIARARLELRTREASPVPESAAEVAQRYLLCDAVARWTERLGETDPAAKTRAAELRRLIREELWDPEARRFKEPDSDATAGAADLPFWPVTAGAAAREAAFDVVDGWLETGDGAGRPMSATGLPAHEAAYWIARGFMRYGRLDGAVDLLETVQDHAARIATQPGASRDEPEEAARLKALWHELTGGERGRVLPPSTPYPGRPPRVPYWAFRPWAWEDNGNTAASTLALVQGYIDRDIPVGVVIIDSPWSTAYNDFNWDRARYPDPAGLVDALHARNVKVVMWLTGTANETSKDTPLQADPAFAEIADRGYAVDQGRVIPWWKGRGRLVDFTNPAATAWWGRRFEQVAALGIDGWKVDQSDDFVDEEVDTFAGRISRSDWKQSYYAAVYGLALASNPASVVLARPFSHQGGFAAPVSRCTIGWSGDFTGDWAGMREQLRNLYISARAGYGTLCFEVGGYYRHAPDKAQLLRQAQLAAFLPVMSNGGANGGLTAHLPWHHDDETVRIYRRFAQWHAALAPYFFGLAIESNLTGRPVLREADAAKWQHRVGDELLVAPVFAGATARTVHASAGETWLDWWTFRPLPPGESGERQVPLDQFPVFVRAGAVIPMDLRAGLADWAVPAGKHGLALWIVPGAERQTLLYLPVDDGLAANSARVSVNATASVIEVRGAALPDLELIVARDTAPRWVEGASRWHYDDVRQLLWVSVEPGGNQITLRLE